MSSKFGDQVNEKQHISEELLDRFSGFLVNKLGLHVPRSNWGNWESKIFPLATAFGFSDINECISWLTSTELDQEGLKVLARHLTIGETYFFRDANAFQGLEEVILPRLLRERKESKSLRIWSAACCTGEEPYSLAICLHRLIPDVSEWNIFILATDINTDFLKIAEKGSYKAWSFRLTKEEIRKKYFIKQADGSEKISPEIQRMVKFMYLNLIEDKYPMLLNGTQGMDLILCNNVLIYFAPDIIPHVVGQLSRSLVSGGWLLSSAVEVPYVVEERLVANKINDTTFFQKQPEEFLEKQIYTPATLKEPTHFEDTVFSLPKISLGSIKPLPAIDIDVYLQLYEKGRYEEVVEQLEKIMPSRIDRKDSAQSIIGCVTLLARSYACMGQLKKALQWVARGLLIDKLDADLYLLQAIIYQELELTDNAINSLQNALFLKPDLIICYYVLGNLNVKRGENKESVRNYRNALRLLRQVEPQSVVPGSEGISAARLMEIISSMCPEVV